MTDRDTLAARFAATGVVKEELRTQGADVLAALRNGLDAASGEAVREGWWRRGGELMQPALLAARRAPHPVPREVAEVRRSLVATGHAGIEEWTYEPIDTTAALAAVDRAEAVVADDHPMAEHVGVHLAEVRLGWMQLRALHAGGGTDGEWAHVWSTRWRLPDAAEIAAARDMLARVPDTVDAGAAITRDEVLSRFAGALAAAAPGWRVEERTGAAAVASTSPDRCTVFVDTARVDSAQTLERLIVHEVFGHAARACRAALRPDMLSAVPLGADAPDTEEAMAMRTEHAYGVASPVVERRYAARLLAVDLASRAGIDEVFAELLPWVGEREAAAIAVRVKRGVRHPYQPGAYSKDVIYRRGSAALDRHLAAHPHDLAVLRQTKWGASVARRFGALFVETGERP